MRILASSSSLVRAPTGEGVLLIAPGENTEPAITGGVTVPELGRDAGKDEVAANREDKEGLERR